MRGKRVAAVLSCVFLAGLGLAAAMAVTAQAHTGTISWKCDNGNVVVTIVYTEFANKPGNTVNEVVTINGHVVKMQAFVFDGPNATDTITIPNAGADTIRVQSSWNTNGEQGSIDSGTKEFSCHVGQTCPPPQTITVTVTNTVTTTAPGSTVYSTTTAPGTTVHDTTTRYSTTTAPGTTVHDTTTQHDTTTATVHDTTTAFSTTTAPGTTAPVQTVTNTVTQQTPAPAAATTTVFSTTTTPGTTTPGPTVTVTKTVKVNVTAKPKSKKKHHVVHKPNKPTHFTPR